MWWRRSSAWILSAIVAVSTGCGDETDAAIADICAHYDGCGVMLPQCSAFFEKVFSDLAARCTNVDEVSARYRDNLSCVAAASCAQLFTACQGERDLYEQAKLAGGSSCEPDDD